MSERFLLSKYARQTKYTTAVFPVDLYFMKYRAEPKVRPETTSKEPVTGNKIQAKPNYQKKTGYAGYQHILPINPVSQIFDPEKFI